MLLPLKKVTLPESLFPQKWQDVLFFNYGFVPDERLAKVLSMPVSLVSIEAERMGLASVSYDGKWEKKGFITLIRNNWFLLPYSQLTGLLGMDEPRLDFILQNEDFLGEKLGGFKPECEEVYYTPLSDVEKSVTTERASHIKKYKKYNRESAFDFFGGCKDIKPDKKYSGKRIVHGYATPCGDVFKADSDEYMPSELLSQYACYGVTGIWVHGLLSALSPYPFGSVGEEYLEKRKKLKDLISRADKYGIKVYLYLNEPRAIENSVAQNHKEIVGHRGETHTSLCMSTLGAKEYLYRAVKDLCDDVVGLGGIITITMSENHTHCQYSLRSDCPVCKSLSKEESAVTVNNVIMRALRDSKSNAELIANLWGWSSFSGWSQENVRRGIEKLDKDITVLCVSEYDLPIEKGGEKSSVIDYSISNVGPSAASEFMLKTAKETGHKVMAKIQINNSWECSAVPYLPVFDLVYEHLKNLSKVGVNDYMLTWTLGGYPSPILDMVAKYASSHGDFSLREWYSGQFGAYYEDVMAACGHFCKGFTEYPFSLYKIYFGPHTLGLANRQSALPHNLPSTMVCYTFDDYEKWITPYSYDNYISQMDKLLSEWEYGLKIMSKLPAGECDELKICAQAAYIHFYTDKLYTQFAFYKRDRTQYATKLKHCISEELKLTDKLIKLAEYPAVGFEASNHYFYNDRNLKAKIIELKNLQSTYDVES